MKFLNKISKAVAFAIAVVLIGSCSQFDVNVNKDPNNPTSAAPNLLLTGIEANLFSNMAGIDGNLSTYVGMMGTQAASRWNYTNTAFDGTWQDLYTQSLANITQLIDYASANNSPTYLGIAKVLKAYAFSTMVDLWGDVPFSEAAIAGSKQNYYPKFDKDADVYAACITLLDESIADLAKTSPVSVGAADLIYGGSAARWSKLAKSMKLKLLMTGRKGISGADQKIKDLIASGGFISGTAEDFKFTFSKDPTSIRHPWYTGAYTGGEFDFSYICHQYMLESYLDLDPRARFYFRNQTVTKLDFTDPSQKSTAPVGPKYGYVPITRWADSLRAKGYDSLFVNGVFGRERGDADGIPADGSFRTLPGVYPCGGQYGVNLTKASLPVANAAAGGGIFPALTEVNIIYYQIEAILALGGTGDAKVLFEDAIRKHISRVVSFGVSADAASVAPTAAAITAYVDKWLARYTAASNNEAKLNVVMKQMWFSSFGSSFEIYNAYRRTGYPNTIDDLKNESPKGKTSYIYRLPYPSSEVNLNTNFTEAQKATKYWVDKIFWNK